MFSDHGLCGLLEEGAHGKSPKCLGGNLGDFGEFCKGLGLVQIPCIERNGIAAEKALKLATLALLEDGTDKKVSLDEVIQTMLQTGRDMKATYKETSLAGLAITLQKKAVPVSVRVVEC